MANPRHMHSIAQNVHDDTNNAIRANIVAGTVSATVDALIIEDVILPTAGQTNPLDVRVVDSGGQELLIDSDGAIAVTGAGGGAGGDVTLVDVNFTTTQTDPIAVTIDSGGFDGDVVITDVSHGGAQTSHLWVDIREQTDNSALRTWPIDNCADEIIVVGQQAVGTSSTTVGSSPTARHLGILIKNDGPDAAYINVNGIATTSHFKLESGASLNIPISQEVRAICDSGESTTLSYMEA